MKKTIYLCDECGKLLSDQVTDIPHLSIHFDEDEYSGGVAPDEVEGRRGTHQTVVGGIKHFCNGKCIGKYFDKLKKCNQSNHA